ncbi:MAG: TOBE domain-containing protein [Candidatus Competibacteraceae bacterium]|nr:TOBE domain-containing protein [Candidatus Competibacteraceae bacterium]MCP5127776.1 TOBE domain-containing protein [Gammaproteobacteria bacterium]HRX70122.1 TOBE domain-containing protein [Candidatus Competibacteraceae bacterium]
MKISARNQFKGRATVLHIGQINADVSVDIGGGDRITASITRKSLLVFV